MKAVLTRHGGGEARAVLHEALAQLVPADVGRPDQHDGPLVGRAGVVQAHLLVRQDLFLLVF